MTTAIDYALMAGASYISNRAEINRLPAPDTWLENIQMRIKKDSGFEATNFAGVNNEIVISFAGTDFSKGMWSVFTSDFWNGNIPLITGTSVNGADQLVDAVEYYLQVKNDPANAGKTISLTGHSLGGALAALVGVFFGEGAFTFDQVPGAATAMYAPAILLRDALLAKGHTTTELASLNAYITAADPSNTNPITADTLAARAASVTNLNVQGEVAGNVPFASRIGSEASIDSEHPGVSSSDLHSIALLTTFLQSNQTANANKSLSDVTYKLADLLKMIFDPNLYAYSTARSNTTDENFLERLVKHEEGVQPDQVTGTGAIPADAMVTRFTSDLWKIAQDGGLTMHDNNSTNPDLHELSKALIAFAMQKYYEETNQSAGYNKQLFTDLTTSGTGSNGIRFDMADVSAKLASAAGLNLKLDLAEKDPNGNYYLKGYQDFLYYLNQTNNGLNATERQLINAILPYMRDWYVQAGTGGMNATDTLNRNAFMLGGSGSDTLVGGSGSDLLVGNAGADTLQGKAGNDFLLGGNGLDYYIYQTGDGFDTILDSDGSGSIVINGATLSGGAQFGGANVHRDANKHLYVDVGNNRMVIDGNILIECYDATQGNALGLTMTGPVADTLPAIQTSNPLNGDLAPVLDANGNLQHDSLGNVITDPNTLELNRADTIYDSAGNDLINTGGGNDNVYKNRSGDDIINLGAGDDNLWTGGTGRIIANGGDGRDYLGAGLGRDLIEGGAGADGLYGSAEGDLLYGDTQGNAQDFITQGATEVGSGLQGEWVDAEGGDDQIFTTAGNDLIAGGDGNDLIVSGGGDDYIAGDWNTYSPADWRDWTVTEHATTGAGGTVNYTYDITHIYTEDNTGTGNDVIYAGAGNDIVFGERGNDVIFGEAGNDKLTGGEGNDVILGGAGQDLIGGDGAAGNGNDYLDGGAEGWESMLNDRMLAAANDATYETHWGRRTA